MYYLAKIVCKKQKKVYGTVENSKFKSSFLGPLQSNKTKLALSIFHCIQSLDRKN